MNNNLSKEQLEIKELDFYNSYKSNIIEKLNENFERIK